MENAWDEMHQGADLRVPKVYKFIIKYITPLFLFSILAIWFAQEWIPIILMRNVSSPDQPYVLLTRLGLAALFLVLALAVKVAWRKKRLNADRMR
jgi:hypothetical protein